MSTHRAISANVVNTSETIKPQAEKNVQSGLVVRSHVRTGRQSSSRKDKGGH